MSLALQFPPVRTSALPPTQRRALIGVVIAVHAVLAYGLMQLRSARSDVAAPAPLLVSLLSPRPSQEPPQAMPRAAKTLPLPMAPEVPVPAVPQVMSASPAVVAATPEPVPAQAVAEAPAPHMVASAAPKLIPPSAVQYLEPPVLAYPRASRRAGEAGRVVLRVLIDEHGLPRQALVNQSSGFARLDEAAIAAVLKARFRPYSDNGQPLAGWALVPLSFDLQT
jgi:protein TonB